MKPPPYSIFILLFFSFFVPAMAQQKKPVAGKVPYWATINQYDYKDTRLDHEAEDGYFDIGFEEQVSLEQQSVFYRRAKKILTEAGIQNCSEISVSFDPSYQQLVFNSIKIIRQDQIINQLNLSKMKTIQQEKELKRHLYDGSLSSVLFLEDVRKGDIIEYSYTLKGFNPIFKRKYADIYDLDYRVPVGSLYYKLIVPIGRQVTIKNNNTDIEPVIQRSSGSNIYEWKLNQVKARRLQDNIPAWYDPYSIIMISEYKSWKEINDWAMELFPVVKDISPGLKKKIDDIRKRYSTEEEQTLAALRFVQDDVRYMGIEMGENSHKPGNPNKIFGQRFGDCKDKSYLLCTILHALGIEASPVLINTSDKKTLLERLPSALAFDHATVQAKLNGKQYWFDPTISFQRGPIEGISYPDYQCGLVVQPGNDSLTMIKVKEKGKTDVREVFDIPDMNGKARLTVITHYTGSFADDVRSSFNNNSNYEMQKSYRDYYAGFYEQITVDSIQYSDDETTGMFITKEYYTINEIWKLEDGKKKASFDPYVIDGVIKKPKETDRNMPYSLLYPANYREEIEINLPEDWNADQSVNTVNTTSVSMRARFSFDGRKTINLEYSYENLKDHVAPADIKEYTDGLNKKENGFSYVLSYTVNDNITAIPPATDKKTDSNYIYIALSILTIIGAIVWRTQRR